MSQYHQGPHFPVSSSPIRPLDAHVTRSTGSPSQPPLAPRAWLQPGANGRHEDPVLSDGRRPLDPLSPPNWRKEIESDVFKPNAQDPHPRSSTGASSPHIPSHHHPNVPVGWQAAPAQLNLVAYKPFPENLAENGTSFFYRSPTPSSRQRTNQACERCRERKTKCSGGRPACIRCQARGLICEYAPESRVRGSVKSRKRNSPFHRTPATSATRRNIAHHDYPPRMSVDHSIWKSQSVTSKASEGAQKIGRTLSGKSTESEESGGADSDVKGHSRDGMQEAGLSSRMLPGIDALHFPFYRSQTAHHNAIPPNKDSPILRVSASMPHLKHAIKRYDGDEYLERSSSSIYSTASLDTSYAELLSSSEDSIHMNSSRCPSSSSSLGSNSRSSLEEEMLAEGISSTTIKFDSWPADSPHENGHNHSPDESEDPVCHGKDNIHTSNVDGNTPRPSSQFNPSEWIHGGDYDHSNSNYQFARSATPKAE